MSKVILVTGMKNVGKSILIDELMENDPYKTAQRVECSTIEEVISIMNDGKEALYFVELGDIIHSVLVNSSIRLHANFVKAVTVWR